MVKATQNGAGASAAPPDAPLREGPGREGPGRDPDAVTVSCTARLHMGFLDLNGGLGRRFGSIGLALDAPRTRVTIRRAAETGASGPERARAGRYLEKMAAHLGLPGGHALTVEAAMPPHSGLGSGTQLALAVAAALRRLHGMPLDPGADALLLGRGGRSGIGIALFREGGLVVDGGLPAAVAAAPPPVLARLAVPPDWRILLVLDRKREGLSGGREVDAFAALAPMTAEASAEICRLVLIGALPGAAEDDLDRFGAAITRVQEIVGDHFAPAQGGRFTSPAVAAALDTLRAEGATGIGQSSWGPTGFAFARGDGAAQRLRDRLAGRCAEKGLDFIVCRGLNRPAAVVAA